MLTKFRGLDKREALIFRGTKRWAEFSPFIEYQDSEAATWLAAAISWANQDLPPLQRTQIGVNATLPAVAIDEIAAVLQRFGKFNTVKIKVAEKGQPLEIDLARIRYVAEHYPGAKIRLDANGNFTVAQALELAAQLPLERMDYFEQPCSSVQELAEFRMRLSGNGLDLQVAADESIRKAQDPYLVAELEAADIVMLKVQPLGGIARALDISNHIGLDCVVSSALETSIGLAQGAFLAGSLPNLRYDCGLATGNLLAGDVCSDPLLAVDGILEIREVEPSAALLEKYAANQSRTRWWLERLERCYQLLKP